MTGACRVLSIYNMLRTAPVSYTHLCILHSDIVSYNDALSVKYGLVDFVTFFCFGAVNTYLLISGCLLYTSFRAGKIYQVHGVGVELDRFKAVDDEEKARLRAEYGYDNDTFIMIYPRCV